MAIELSNLTFTELEDIVPKSGVEEILNTGIANTLAGNDTITALALCLTFSVTITPSARAFTIRARLIPTKVTI